MSPLDDTSLGVNVPWAIRPWVTRPCTMCPNPLGQTDFMLGYRFAGAVEGYIHKYREGGMVFNGFQLFSPFLLYSVQ